MGYPIESLGPSFEASLKSIRLRVRACRQTLAQISTILLKVPYPKIGGHSKCITPYHQHGTRYRYLDAGLFKPLAYQHFRQVSLLAPNLRLPTCGITLALLPNPHYLSKQLLILFGAFRRSHRFHVFPTGIFTGAGGWLSQRRTTNEGIMNIHAFLWTLLYIVHHNVNIIC